MRNNIIYFTKDYLLLEQCFNYFLNNHPNVLNFSRVVLTTGILKRFETLRQVLAMF